MSEYHVTMAVRHADAHRWVRERNANPPPFDPDRCYDWQPLPGPTMGDIEGFVTGSEWSRRPSLCLANSRYTVTRRPRVRSGEIRCTVNLRPSLP